MTLNPNQSFAKKNCVVAQFGIGYTAKVFWLDDNGKKLKKPKTVSLGQTVCGPEGANIAIKTTGKKAGKIIYPMYFEDDLLYIAVR